MCVCKRLLYCVQWQSWLCCARKRQNSARADHYAQSTSWHLSFLSYFFFPSLTLTSSDHSHTSSKIFSTLLYFASVYTSFTATRACTPLWRSYPQPLLVEISCLPTLLHIPHIFIVKEKQTDFRSCPPLNCLTASDVVPRGMEMFKALWISQAFKEVSMRIPSQPLRSLYVRNDGKTLPESLIRQKDPRFNISVASQFRCFLISSADFLISLSVIQFRQYSLHQQWTFTQRRHIKETPGIGGSIRSSDWIHHIIKI